MLDYPRKHDYQNLLQIQTLVFPQIFCSNILWYSCFEEPQTEPISATLRKKCPNAEFYLVRILPYEVRIRENTDQKKFRIWTLLTQHCLSWSTYFTPMFPFYLTNTQRVFQVKTTWKRSFHVISTWNTRDMFVGYSLFIFVNIRKPLVIWSFW